MEFSEAALIALAGALFGFLGGLIPSMSSALRLKRESLLAAKKADLDALRVVIDELTEEILRRKNQRVDEQKEVELRYMAQNARFAALEKDCIAITQITEETKNKLAVALAEISRLNKVVLELESFITILSEVLKLHNIPLPEKKTLGGDQ